MSQDPSRVVDAYTRAADTFDTLPFWHHFGQRTVDRLALTPGARVVDFCCGTGASALPAAIAVGPSGHVLGVDVTPALIAVAERRAADARLTQAHFVAADVRTLELPAASVDAVVSVFGLFFLDDMAAMLRRAWQWLAPGGRLATTAWGETVLEPGEAWFWKAVLAEDPSIERMSHAARLATPQAVIDVYRAAGLPDPEVTLERWRMPLASPEAFWPVVMGTSNRGAFDALPPEAQARVKHTVIERLRAAGVEALEMEALVAVARK